MNDPRLNLLIAYPYFKRDNIEWLEKWDRSKWRLIVDSGAFTAWKSKKPIQLDDYCRFLDSIEHLRPFNAVQLDVFGDPAASHRNLLTMRERGYDVMPVFTRGDTLERLEEFYSTTDYIMFGGIVTGGQNTNYVKWFIDNNKGRKAHWLGFVNMDFIKAYRPESVDSSSWASARRFGSVHLYAGHGHMKSASREDFAKKPKDSIVECLQRVGIDYDQIRLLANSACWYKQGFDGTDWSKPSSGMTNFISVLSHVARMYDVERKLGTKIYQAGNNLILNSSLVWAMNYLEKHCPGRYV